MNGKLRRVPANRSHISYLAENARPEEIREAAASGHRTMEDALLRGYLCSDLCETILNGDTPVAIWGVRPDNYEWDRLWFLGSRHVPEIRYDFLKYIKRGMPEALKRFPNVRNWCDARYVQSLKWTAWLGFHVDRKPVRFGGGGELFYRYWLRSGSSGGVCGDSDCDCFRDWRELADALGDEKNER